MRTETFVVLCFFAKQVVYGFPLIKDDNIDTGSDKSSLFSEISEKLRQNILNNDMNHQHEVPRNWEDLPTNESANSAAKHGPRCGVPDMKRTFNLENRMNNERDKWAKHDLTWFFDSKHGQYNFYSSKIRRIIRQTLDVWSQNSVLTFQEVSSFDYADIVLSFEQPYHPDVDPYEMYDGVLAHAFGPGTGLGGDVHFNYDLDWDMNIMFGEQPASESAMSLFAVALHEIGHSLGLSHSENPEAVMYDSYTKNTGILSVEDITRIQELYGIPERFNKESNITTENYLTTETTELPITTDVQSTTHRTIVPDRCDTTYDAITIIHGELFIFKDIYMWRPQHGDSHSIIRGMWSELPSDFTHIDAVFQDDDGRILFFIGRSVYVFKGNRFAYRTTLTRYGIDQSVSKIDAIFKWHYNKRSYIFSGDKFWRLDGDFVAKNYPKSIRSRWRLVDRIETSFSNDSSLYFLKNKFLYEFDHHTMSLDHHRYQLASQVFMKCPLVSNIAEYSVNDNEREGNALMVQEQTDIDSLSYLWLFTILSIVAVVVALIIVVFAIIVFMLRKFSH